MRLLPSPARRQRAAARHAGPRALGRLAGLVVTLSCGISLIAAAGAQAVVVNVNPSAPAPSASYGVALAPGNGASDVTAAGLTVDTSSSTTCPDPWLSSDFVAPVPDTRLCWHGGQVIHSANTLAVTWDPLRRYWSGTRYYVEQFLRNVADASGANGLGSPYAVTGQYADGHADPSNPTGPNPTGQARNARSYVGGCIDYGAAGGSSCQFANAIGTAQGHNYPGGGGCAPGSTTTCVLPDAAVRDEVAAMVAATQLTARSQPGATPEVVVLTPANVQVCLDSGDQLCSVTSGSSASVAFCSYHSETTLADGTKIPYVVQPWTAGTACDESPLPTVTDPGVDAGQRLVSPLSKSQIAATVDPMLDGWFANDGSEIDDNGCQQLGDVLDNATINSSTYVLQSEFNNGGVLESDPNAPACAHSVVLAPTFVVPSTAKAGDAIAFDGSTTASTLIVPRTGYVWSFGDGTIATGPSVVHRYAAAGSYKVTLTVTDRGGNVVRTSTSATPATIVITGAPAPVTPPKSPSLSVKVQVMPESLATLASQGLALRVTANGRADGVVAVSMSGAAARRAHITTSTAATVVIGRGTINGQVKAGTVTLHLRLASATAAKLKALGHVTLTVQLSLVGTGGQRVSVSATAGY